MAIPALLIPAAISGVKSLFSYWTKTKEEKAAIKKVKLEGEIQINKSKIEAKVRKLNLQYTMDANAASDMRYSWKDEFFVLLLALPYLMSFIPQLAPYVGQGFAVLKTTPEWYQYSFLGAIAATFGLRAWFNKMGG